MKKRERAIEAASTASDERKTESFERVGLLLSAAILLAVLVGGVASALADEPNPQPQNFGLPPAVRFIQEIESESTASPVIHATDPTAAESVPHRDLDREEAIELLQEVFGPELQAPAGIFDDLEVEKFLSPYVAVIPADGPPTSVRAAPSSAPAAAGAEDGEPEPPPANEKEALRAGWPAAGETQPEVPDRGSATAELDGATVLDSTLPLRTEGASGHQEVVDLSLEHAEGELQSANPLVEVGIPQHLSEGIELTGPDVQIELEGAAQDRSPSTVDGSVAVYPNVTQDTDLVVAPTPTGVETLTHIRSAESPRSQTFNLDLPAGATLEGTAEGGAVVKDGEESLVAVAPPAAIDATGADVPVSLDVAGSSIALTISPEASTTFPVLLDPLFQTYDWTKAGTKWYQDGICNSSFETHVSNQCNSREEWGYEHIEKSTSGHITVDNIYNGSTSKPGLFVKTAQNLTSGDRGSLLYTVPRYFTDQEHGLGAPTSYISKMALTNVKWEAFSAHPSPYLFMGLWSPNASKWISSYSHEGATGHGFNEPSFPFEFKNGCPGCGTANTDGKVGYVSMQVTETQPTQNADVFVGSAAIELADNDVPSGPIATGPSAWVNQPPATIAFTASDSGLGVSSLKAATEQLGENGQPLHSWKASYGCLGVGDAACPRTWVSTEAGHPSLTVEPALLTQGIDYLSVIAEDPVGNKSAPSYAQVKVDHTAPQIALSGTLIEQSTLGTKRPSYTLKANVTDGAVGAPQSGAAKAAIEVDGKEIVAESKPGCATENCVIPLEWKLESSKFSTGEHTIKVTASDGVGLAATPKELKITLNQSPPTLNLSGTMTEQATLSTTRPRYNLKLDAAAESGIPAAASTPSFSSVFGSSGTGTGQFSHPGDLALDAKGNLWAVDQGNNRIEEFNEKGEYLKSLGSYGTGNGQLSMPKSLAIDLKGNIWVMDAGNNRVEEFNEKGEYVNKFGFPGSGNGQLSGAEGIAVDAKGNIWVADTYNARVQKFNEKGEFLKVVGSYGYGTGQLVEPTGIDIGPGGNVWVTDWANNKVVVFSEAGEYISQFGSAGTGNGQLANPDAIAIDTKGNVWVGDQNNERVQEFNATGEYVGKFGSGGSGTGQFNFGYPMGIAVDTKGNLWVTDTGNNRVQKWLIPNWTPTFANSFGSTGSGSGQFSGPADVAVDGYSNRWVVDSEDSRLEHFGRSGEYLGQLGGIGSGNGKLNLPASVAIDPSGNIWVADFGNRRVEEFNEEGKYLSQFGGSTAGMLYPRSIAVSSSGNLFVLEENFASTLRLREYSPTGQNLKAISSKGSAAGQIYNWADIAVGSGGTIWVADPVNNRVSVFNKEGAFLRQFGTAGSGPGQFSWVDGITVANGNVWVVDSGNSRVEEFNEKGEFMSQFGTGGSGNGQFSFAEPNGIATDAKGGILVADYGNNRVQRWAERPWESEVTAEVTVDGKLVASNEAGCSTEHCPVAREWTLNSTAYSPGKHTVLAKATDGLGNTTTKSLTIEVQPDTTKPSIESGGSLINAPEGWVEQEGYGLNVSAKDAGYGATSLELKIDGQQVAAAPATTCPDGGCEAQLQKTINMAPYSGGAHPAEIVSKDGAGNTSAQHWTINVDPEGHISSQELAATLEAAEETSPINPIGDAAPPEAPAGIRSDIKAVETVGGFEAEGSEVPVYIARNPSDGLTAEIPDEGVFSGCDEPRYVDDHEPEGEPAELTEAEVLQIEHEADIAQPSSSEPCPSSPPESLDPIENLGLAISPEVSSSAGAVRDVNGGNAVVAPNTAVDSDMITRPLYEGALVFQAIRSADAPQTYSWDVHLGAGQSLVSIDSQHAEVLYQNGHPAFGIEAEPAHDAAGTEVDTSLTVTSAETITLNVGHRAHDYVYPVVAGAGWRGGFVSAVVEGPKDETELREEREREEREARKRLEQEWREEEEGGEPPVGGVTRKGSTWHVRAAVIGPPIPGLATSSSNGEHPAYHRFRFSECFYKAIPESIAPPGEPFPGNEPAYALIGNCARQEGNQDELNAGLMVLGYFAYNQAGWVWVNQAKGYEMNCHAWGPHEYKAAHCFARPWKVQGALTARGDFRGFLVSGNAECVTVYGHLSTNVPHRVAEESISSLTGAGPVFEPCNWPAPY